MNVVEGAEESKGELPEQDEDGLSPETPQPSPSAFPWHFSVQQALRQYNILAEGAREGGPDYTPCEWEPSMLLQDIPWRQLPLSVPLDVLLASSPPPTSRKFAGPLSTIFNLWPTPRTTISCGSECVFCRRSCSSTYARVDGPTLMPS